MSGFGGYGSGEFKIVFLGAFIGFFVGLPHGGLKGGLIGALAGGIGLFVFFLLLVFICWAIGNVVIKIRGRKSS
jgi:hypothetical protein